MSALWNARGRKDLNQPTFLSPSLSSLGSSTAFRQQRPEGELWLWAEPCWLFGEISSSFWTPKCWDSHNENAGTLSLQ